MRARLITILAILSLVVAACGGGDDAAPDPTGAPAEASTSAVAAESTTSVAPSSTAEATTTTAAAQDGSGTLGALLASADESTTGSGRFEATMTMVPAPGTEIPGPIAFSFSGAFDEATQSSEMSMDLSGMAEMIVATEGAGEDEQLAEMFATFFSEPLQIITIGNESWMKWSFFSSFLGAGDNWIAGSADMAGETTGSLGFGAEGGSPSDFLAALEDADAQVEEVGSEEVRGEPTTHYKVVLDIEALAAEATPEERAELDELLGQGAPSEFPMDVWLDGDGLLRRFTMAIDASDMEDAAELESATLTFEIWDYGADIVIVPPPANQVVDGASLGFDG